jgi:hypothetical protein
MGVFSPRLVLCHGHGEIIKPSQSDSGQQLTGWFLITGTVPVAANGKMLNRLFCLIVHRATMVDNGHGFFVLDAGRE